MLSESFVYKHSFRLSRNQIYFQYSASLAFSQSSSSLAKSFLQCWAADDQAAPFLGCSNNQEPAVLLSPSAQISLLCRTSGDTLVRAAEKLGKVSFGVFSDIHFTIATY